MCQSIEEKSFFNEVEDIWDEIAHILSKRAYELELGTLCFIFRYQKSTLQYPRKSVSRRVQFTLLVSIKDQEYNEIIIISKNCIKYNV